MLRHAIATAVCAAALAAPARAAFVDLAASDLGGNTLVENDAGPGALALDPTFATNAPIALVIVLEADDLGAPIALNALVSNTTGELWPSLALELEGALFAEIGSVRANAGAVAGVVSGASSARIDFDPAEPAGVDLGAPLGDGADWLVDTGALGAGGAFTLRFVPVPEPGTLWLCALGLGALPSRRRARRRGERDRARASLG